MSLDQGKAEYSKPMHSLEVDHRRRRATSKASARLANLHPHEWSVLLKAALEEEGLTD